MTISMLLETTAQCHSFAGYCGALALPYPDVLAVLLAVRLP